MLRLKKLFSLAIVAALLLALVPAGTALAAQEGSLYFKIGSISVNNGNANPYLIARATTGTIASNAHNAKLEIYGSNASNRVGTNPAITITFSDVFAVKNNIREAAFPNVLSWEITRSSQDAGVTIGGSIANWSFTLLPGSNVYTIRGYTDVDKKNYYTGTFTVDWKTEEALSTSAYGFFSYTSPSANPAGVSQTQSANGLTFTTREWASLAVYDSTNSLSQLTFTIVPRYTSKLDGKTKFFDDQTTSLSGTYYGQPIAAGATLVALNQADITGNLGLGSSTGLGTNGIVANNAAIKFNYIAVNAAAKTAKPSDAAKLSFTFTGDYNTTDVASGYEVVSTGSNKSWILDYTVNFGTGSTTTTDPSNPSITDYTASRMYMSNIPSGMNMTVATSLSTSGQVFNASSQQLSYDSNWGSLHVDSTNNSVISVSLSGNNSATLYANNVGTTTLYFWYGDTWSTYSNASSALRTSFTISVNYAQATAPPVYVPQVTPPPTITDTRNIATGTRYGWSKGSSVNVRSGPSTSNSKVGKMNKGDSFIILSTESNFYKILSGNGTAYVSNGYSETYTTNEPASRGRTTRKCNALNSASTAGKSLGTMSNGSDVMVVGESGSYYKIIYRGNYAYVLKSYVTMY